MSKNGIRVEEFNIYSLGAEAVSYHLKDIHTLAMQVTRKNIGILALEFETELIYTADAEPYLNIHVARGPKEEPENDRNLIVRPNDWLVILWDEIHLFKDPEFRSTFSFDGLSAPAEKELREYAEQDVKDSENVFRPHVHIPISGLVGEIKQSGVPADYHAGSLYRSEGQEPGFYDKDNPRFIRLRDKASGDVVMSTIEAWTDMHEDAKSMFELVEDETQIVPAVGELEENLNRETEEKTE